MVFQIYSSRYTVSRKSFQPQFSVDKPYKLNVAGLSEQKIGIAHQNNYNIDQPDIADLLVNDFSCTLHKWRDLYPTGVPIFAKHIGCGTIDELNTLIYTILKYFVGLPSNISPRVSRLSNILRCSTMIGNKWYQDVFVSRIMLQKNYYKPCWKGRFIDGLPPIFAHKVKQVLISANEGLLSSPLKTRLMEKKLFITVFP